MDLEGYTKELLVLDLKLGGWASFWVGLGLS